MPPAKPECRGASTRAACSLFAGVFDEVGCDDDWAVNEQWRPRPSTEPPVLAQHLGEFVCREFARERRIAITCLRLGNLGQPNDKAAQRSRPDPAWLSLRMMPCTLLNARLAAPAEPWVIYHIQSAFPGARFSSAKRGMGNEALLQKIRAAGVKHEGPDPRRRSASGALRGPRSRKRAYAARHRHPAHRDAA